jgi:transposase
VATTTADPKVAALVATRSLNPHPEMVTDTVFLASPFCDARDVVQVKYEMVRRVRVDGLPVTQAARAFGYCRQAFYEVAAALDAGGPSALAAGKPGPKGPLKLTDPVMDQVEGWLAADPDLRSRDLADRVQDVFGFPVHPRSVERALARRRETRDSPEPKTRP